MGKASKISGKSLEGLLVHWGLLSEEAAASASAHSQNQGVNIARALAEKGFMSEASVAEAICSNLSLAFMNAEAYQVSGEVSRLLPAEFQQQHEILVLDRFDKTIVLATCGVPDDELLDEIKERTGCDCQLFVTTAGALRKCLVKLGSTARQGAEAMLHTSAVPEDQTPSKPHAEDERLFDPNVIRVKGREAPAEVHREKKPEPADAVRQEADQLFAELERDLERFAPLDESADRHEKD